MNQEQVIALMKSSTSEDEWSANCDKVKADCGGYPDFWFRSIILSGVMDDIAKQWGGSSAITIVTLEPRG